MTKAAAKHINRGYCGIGIENAKTATNLGTLWRSAFCLGADFIFTIGDRYHKQSSDTVQAWRHIPYWPFKDWDDFAESRPHDCPLVAIEITDKARSLSTFTHPERAIYLLGPEDGGISKAALEAAQSIVRIPSLYCLNVATAGSIVLYDRNLKRGFPKEGFA